MHRNDKLENVGKFSYLRGLLVGPPRSVIAGFALTSANYQAAVEPLNKWYGKKEAIQRASVNELLNVQPVYNERRAETSELVRFPGDQTQSLASTWSRRDHLFSDSCTICPGKVAADAAFDHYAR